MIINIWTTNEIKLGTVRDLEGYYERFVIDSLVPHKVDSGIVDQPMSMEETILWASNRAKNAYAQSPCDFAIWMESGLMPSVQANTGYVACEVAVIRDGEKKYIGIWGGIEYPKAVTDRIVNHGEDLNTAFLNAWFSEEFAGDKNGIMGFLTDNRITRKDYPKQVIIYALTQLHNKDLY